MELTTFCWQEAGGWSEAPPDWDGDRTLCLVFGARRYLDDPRPLQALRDRYPRSHVLGCSTAGEICGTAILDDALSVAVLRFRRVRLRGHSEVIDPAGDSYAAGRRLAAALSAPDLRAVFVLSDGLRINGSELVRGLNSVLPEAVVVTGGLAGDGESFRRTWTLYNGPPEAGRVRAVGFYGAALRVGHGSRGGWDIFGPLRRVTRARGNVLYELDGRPALELYKRYLGALAAELPAAALRFPLAIQTEGGGGPIVRTVLAVDEADQSMTFAGDIPQGARVQLMHANFDRLLDGASDAARQTLADFDAGAGPVLGVAVSCVGRRMLLGDATEEELESALGVLPPGTRLLGFYSYGEISPHASGQCDLHNQTMTLTLLGEAAD